MEEERGKGIIRQVQMGKRKQNIPSLLCSPCACCVFSCGLPGSAYCMHFVVFLPSRSPAMGNLIKVLGKDLENCPHFFLDFESK